MSDKYAIFFDGGFVQRVLPKLYKSPISLDLLNRAVSKIAQSPQLTGKSLLRCYYYDAAPFKGVKTTPTGDSIDFSKTPQYERMSKFHESLKFAENFAFRCGDLKFRGWHIPETKKDDDSSISYKPTLDQKGVDIKIGLDIALMSMKRFIDVIVIFTGDADIAPAMKFARKEGLNVYYISVSPLSNVWIANEVRIHSDGAIELSAP